MKSNVEKIDKNRVVLEVEVESEEFEKAVQKAYKKLVRKVNIPGFRKGKAPRKVLETYIGEGSLYSEAADIIIPEAYYNAVQETKIEPINQPEVEITQLGNGKPFIFKATVEVKPEVKLGQYKGLAIEKKEYPVTDQDVEDYLKNLQERYARLVSKESGTVEKGDIALIDFEGFVDGEAFPGGKGENYSLEIGSNTFIPGFEDQLVGMSIDEEKEINVTFPEDYHSEELAGKPAIFKVKVKGIKVKEYSPLDDEFAKDVSEFETLEELKNDIRNKLKEAAENRSLSEVKIAVINKAAENAEVEIPEIMIESKIASYVNEMAQRLAQQGLKFEHYLEYSGQTMEQIKETFKPQAKKEVKNDLVIEAIAKAENIIATEEEVDKEIEKMAKYYNQEAGKLKEMFAAQGNLPALEASIQLDKAVDFLVSEAKIEIVSDGKEETKKEE
ncbi:MAG: trigger factor [Zhaonellaceae bacterium]|jgi:trigger factor|nr:trigger factor [Clostridia bacterium]